MRCLKIIFSAVIFHLIAGQSGAAEKSQPLEQNLVRLQKCCPPGGKELRFEDTGGIEAHRPRGIVDLG